MSNNLKQSQDAVVAIVNLAEKHARNHPHGKFLKSLKFKWFDGEIVEIEKDK